MDRSLAVHELSSVRASPPVTQNHLPSHPLVTYLRFKEPSGRTTFAPVLKVPTPTPQTTDIVEGFWHRGIPLILALESFDPTAARDWMETLQIRVTTSGTDRLAWHPLVSWTLAPDGSFPPDFSPWLEWHGNHFPPPLVRLVVPARCSRKALSGSMDGLLENRPAMWLRSLSVAASNCSLRFSGQLDEWLSDLWDYQSKRKIKAGVIPLFSSD